jgi:hypothetical protein
VRRAGLLWLLAAGCGSSPHVPFAPCDTQSSECQTQVYRAVAERRGQPWDPWSKPPRVGLISLDGLRRRLELDPAVFGRNGLWSQSLQQLDLLTTVLSVSGADELWQLDNLDAVYSPLGRAVTMVDRGRSTSDAAATAVLARVFVLAAQDREIGTLTTDLITTDQTMLRTALLEGEAELYGTMARVEMDGQDPAAYDWDGHFRPWVAEVRAQTLVAPSSHTLVRLALIRPLGGAWMARAWRRARDVGVDDAFLRQPPSFLALMQAQTGVAVAPRTPGRCQLSLDRDAFRSLDRDELGAGVFYAYLSGLSSLESEAWTSALTWQRDEIWIFADLVRAKQVFLWRVHAPGLAASPLGALLATRPGPPFLEGDDLYVFSPEDTDAIAAIRKGLACP